MADAVSTPIHEGARGILQPIHGRGGNLATNTREREEAELSTHPAVRGALE